MYIGLFSCMLLSYNMSTYFKSKYHERNSLFLYIALFSYIIYRSLFMHIGLFSCMSVSFHVYCPVLTHIKSVSIAKGGLFLYFIYWSLSMYIGLFSSVYWFLFMYTGLFDQTSKVSVSRKEVSFHL